MSDGGSIGDSDAPRPGAVLVLAGGGAVDRTLLATLLPPVDGVPVVIAADNGALLAASVAVPVHHLVGDLDSLDAATVDRLAAGGTTVHRHPVDKDETDLELALALALDQGGCRIYRTSPNGYLGFCKRDEAGPSIVAGRAEPILTLVTPDVDAWHARLTARGLRFETPPVYNPRFDIYHCFLRDPSGYLVEIQAFCDPGWPGGGHLPRPG